MRLRKNEFVAYLKRNQDAIFDRRANESCPIACFVGRDTEEEVDVSDIDIWIGGTRYNPPPWVKAFITKWDDSKARTGKGKVALKIMESQE